MSFNLPNSYLLGILLVVSTHSGPQLVYNYPPILSHDSANRANTAKLMLNSDDDSSGDDSNGEGDEDDEYLVDSDDEDDAKSSVSYDSKEDLKWDARNLNFYMGTKKDLLSFLDDQEKHREKAPEHRKSKKSIDGLPLEKTISSKSEKSLLHNALHTTISNATGLSSQTTFQLGAPAIPTSSQSHQQQSPQQQQQQHSSPQYGPSDPQEPGSSQALSGKGNSSSSLNSNSQTGSPMSNPINSSDQNNNNKPSDSSTANTIFGIEADYLCETLCPPRQMCNSRFEILIDDLVFLGLPVHCYDNGSWRSKKKKTTVKKKSSNLTRDDSELGGENSINGHDGGSQGNGADSGSFNGSTDKPNSSAVADDETKNATMSMFHLVFVMNPPIIECNYRIDEMFHYVISRLSLVLRYEQSKHDYVWHQVKLIQKLKEEFRTATGPLNLGGKSATALSSYLTQKSSLCKMISECFHAVSKSKIANLSINSKLRSFQIPIKTEFHSLPETTVPYLPGSHLSSTVSLLAKTGLINVGDTTRYGMSNIMNMMTMMGGGNGYSGSTANNGAPGDDEDFLNEDDSDSTEDIIHFALLLLDDPEAIVSDIKAEPNSTLANFIRMIKPTESLSKLATKLEQSPKVTEQLSIREIKSFAFHLIYWRRARVIPPLNSRSVYIVSPMAPVTLNLFYDIQRFSSKFTTLPTLPHFLKSLSSTSRKPKQFATIIPSRDHREVYLEALAWLIRYGYVTQLHTFIWLKISRKIKMKVEEDLENEASGKKAGKGSISSAIKGGRGSQSDPSLIDSASSSVPSTPAIPSDSTAAVGGTDNTSKKIGKGKGTHSNHSSSYIPGNLDSDGSPTSGPNIILEEDSDTIILDPDRATTLERRWINKVVHEECRLSTELTAVFYKLLKYMNGKNSLELLLLKEDVNRNDLRKLLFAIEDHVISVKHW